MRKRMLSVVSFLLCLVLIGSTPAYAVEAYASDQSGTPAYDVEAYASDQINITSNTLSRSSDGQLTICFYIYATGKMDVLGASSVVVQRLSGSTWVTEYTYTVKNTPELQTNGAAFYRLPLKYTPSYPEASYRTVVYFYAKGSLGTSTKTVTSKTV